MNTTILGHLQNGCEAMADEGHDLLVHIDKRTELSAPGNRFEH